MNVELPFSESAPTGYLPGRISVKLSADQRVVLRRVLDAAAAENAVLANGKKVATVADAIRFVAEQIGAAGEI